MFEKVKDIVFGFGEYDKTKIDVRFDIVKTYLPKLEINTLSDFEMLEETLYKIKDQIRVKSSNLNRIINDPDKQLSKKDVDLVINTLTTLKYNFLKKAIDLIDIDKKTKTSTHIDEHDNNTLEDNYTDEINDQNQEETENEIKEYVNHTNTLNKTYDNEEEIKIFENENYLITLNNSSHPYILVKFHEKISYSMLSKLSIALFESSSCHGTNVIIENNTALILPRYANDNLFELPRIQSNIDNIYEKLKEQIKPEKNHNNDLSFQTYQNEIKENKKKENKFETYNEEPEESSIVKNDINEDEIQDADYIEINKKEDIIKPTLKNKEDSLENLLSKSNNYTEDITNHTNKKTKNNDKIEIIESEPIEVEKIEKEKTQNLIKKDINNKEEEKDEIILETSDDINNTPFEIYSDENIRAYLCEETAVPGEMIIETKSGQKLSELNESDLSYISLFAKAFTGPIFDVKQAHGTNIIWNFDDNKIKIVPRFEDDQLTNFKWTPKTHSQDFLEQIKNKLLAHMHGVANQNNNDKSMTKNSQKQIPTEKQPKEQKQLQKQSPDELKARADYLLKAIRKIP